MDQILKKSLSLIILFLLLTNPREAWGKALSFQDSCTALSNKFFAVFLRQNSDLIPQFNNLDPFELEKEFSRLEKVANFFRASRSNSQAAVSFKVKTEWDRMERLILEGTFSKPARRWKTVFREFELNFITLKHLETILKALEVRKILPENQFDNHFREFLIDSGMPKKVAEYYYSEYRLWSLEEFQHHIAKELTKRYQQFGHKYHRYMFIRGNLTDLKESSKCDPRCQANIDFLFKSLGVGRTERSRYPVFLEERGRPGFQVIKETMIGSYLATETRLKQELLWEVLMSLESLVENPPVLNTLYDFTLNVLVRRGAKVLNKANAPEKFGVTEGQKGKVALQEPIFSRNLTRLFSLFYNRTARRDHLPAILDITRTVDPKADWAESMKKLEARVFEINQQIESLAGKPNTAPDLHFLTEEKKRLLSNIEEMKSDLAIIANRARELKGATNLEEVTASDYQRFFRMQAVNARFPDGVFLETFSRTSSYDGQVQNLWKTFLMIAEKHYPDFYQEMIQAKFRGAVKGPLSLTESSSLITQTAVFLSATAGLGLAATGVYIITDEGKADEPERKLEPKNFVVDLRKLQDRGDLKREEVDGLIRQYGISQKAIIELGDELKEIVEELEKLYPEYNWKKPGQTPPPWHQKNPEPQPPESKKKEESKQEEKKEIKEEAKKEDPATIKADEKDNFWDDLEKDQGGVKTQFAPKTLR